MTGRIAASALVAIVAACGGAGRHASSVPGRGCRPVGSHGAARYELCFRPNRLNEDGKFVVIRAGRRRILHVPPPGKRGRGTPVVGHWRSARLSPDGKTLVATWSGECESSSRYRVSIVTGVARPLTTATGC